MFNKERFANVLKQINSKYASMTEFSKSADFDRTYISKGINLKLSNPPTPDILKKIANSSKGVVTYIELMYICGYITYENMSELENLLNKVYNLKSMENNVKNLLDTMNLNDNEKEIATNYANETLHQLKHNPNTTYEQLSEAVLNELKDFNNIDVDKIYGYYILKIANSLKTLDYNIDNTEENHKMLKLDLSIFDDDDIEDIKKYIDFIKSKKNLKD